MALKYNKERQMKSENLLDALKKKFKCSSDKELADCLGITSVTISNWRSKGANITPTQIANLIYRSTVKCEREARLFSIKPIVEYYPIEASESARGVNWEVFDSRSEGNGKFKKLRDVLSKAIGIYVFYDSQCKALYVGKAKDQNLWREMNNAFNRDRETQKIYTVNHPSIGQNFIPAYIKLRQPVKTHLQLSDLACYFSAYEVHRDFIENIEAMLIRAFANTVLNVSMEKIKLRP